MHNAANVALRILRPVALALLTLAVSPTPALAQISLRAQNVASTHRIKPLAELSRDVWTTRDGLPHNQVSAIRQTPDGYLWFATWEGVVRYNGVSFRVFDRSNTPALTDNGTRSLHVMRDGGVLIGTARGGVVSVDTKGRWRVWTTAQGLAQNEVWRAIEDRRGRIWVASESAGIDRVDAAGVRHFGKADGLPSEALLDLAEDGDGAIWVASALGVVRIVDDGIEAVSAQAGLPATDAEDVEVGSDGSIWVATRRGGFVRRPGSSRFERVTPEDLDAVIMRVHPGERGAALFGTANEGVLALAGGRLDRFQDLPNAANNRVMALFRDREGSIWVGTSAALLRLRDTPFSTLTTEHGLPDDYVRTVLEGSDGTLWIGTSSGLASVPSGGATPIASATGLQTESILALARARDGGIWVGTYTKGLLHYRDGRVVQRWTTLDGLAHNEVRAVLEAIDGTVWVGTPFGLSRIRSGEIASFATESGLPRLFVSSLAQSRDGRIWVGTLKGVAISSGEGFRTLSLPAGVEAQAMFGFHEDERGVMWIASNRGLLRVEKDRVAAIGQDQGLPIDNLFAVVADQLGKFWLSSNRGVMRLARADADAVATGARARVEVEQFGEHDGLITAQCNGGSSPAAAVTADGRIWIATAHGVAFVQPRELARFAHEAPPAVIEEVMVDGRAVANNGAIVLAPGQRRLEIHYAALSYVAPARIRYRYRLDGLDQDWADSGERHSAQFTNLSPGTYRFRVEAMLPGGAWSHRAAVLPISVQPYFYQTPWFVVLCGAIVAALAWGLYRVRLRLLTARVAVLTERHRIAREIHDTLGQGFAGVSIQLEGVMETLRQSPEIAEKHLDQARSLVRRSMEQARRSVLALHPEDLDDIDLAAALQRVAADVTAGSTVRIDMDVTGTRQHLSAETAWHLLQIGREALSNAVRHAQPTRIRIGIAYGDRSVDLKVTDDGRGFDGSDPQASGGFGMVSMRERAQLIHAVLNVHSASNHGTEVTVTVPTR